MNTTELKKHLVSCNPNDTYIGFEWPYGVNGKEIIVANITQVYEDRVLCHFLYGYKSEAEFVRYEDIKYLGDNQNGTFSLKGWKGKFIKIN